MDYIQLLVASYDLARVSHEFGKMLIEVKAEKGTVYVPQGFSEKLEEFYTALASFAEKKCIAERKTDDEC